MDFERGVLRVTKQLSRSGEYVPPKTAEAVREVVLCTRLAHLLREHRLASAFSGDDEPVFANAAGRPFEHRTRWKPQLATGGERAVLPRSRFRSTVQVRRQVAASG